MIDLNHLQKPPRKVPSKLRYWLIFFGDSTVGAWTGLLFMTVFLQVSGFHTIILRTLALLGSTEEVIGIITERREGRKTGESYPKYLYTYQYEYEGVKYEGKNNKRTVSEVAKDAQITVVFSQKHPQYNYVKEIEDVEFSYIFCGVIVIPVLLIFVDGVTLGIRKGIKHAKLLKIGEFTEGTFLSANKVRNKKGEFKYVIIEIGYQDNTNRPQIYRFKMHDSDISAYTKPKQVVLYNPQNTKEATTINKIDDVVSITEKGEITHNIIPNHFVIRATVAAIAGTLFLFQLFSIIGLLF